MNIKLYKVYILLFLNAIASLSAYSQGFEHMVSLPKITSKGFHKIIIAPAISAHSNTNFSDLRLFNQQKQEVPYILRKDFMRKQQSNFVPYQLIAKSTPGDTVTELILKNQFNTKINNLSIFLNNAEVSKQVIISGSYNQKEWYAVKQHYNLTGIANQNNVTELNTIYFPLSDYTFYKILINDKHSLPVKVVKAGYYQDTISYGEETLLPAPELVRTENSEEHISQIQLNFNGAYTIDKINIKISAPTLYRRPIKIYALRENNGNSYKEYLQESTLFAGSNNQITLEQVHAQKLLLEITNDNNPLLEINQVECFQLSQYIMAYLEQTGIYNLKFGNKEMQPPVYDLAFFENVIPASIPIIQTNSLSIINDPEKPVTKTIKPAYYNKKFFLWTAIIAVTLVLMLITGKMLNEMNKKKN